MKKLRRLYEKIVKFINLNNREKLRFLQAYIYTGYFRAYILFKPFNKLKDKMGTIKSESEMEIDEKTYNEVKKISQLVNRVSKYTFWDSKCLVQALTAQKLLTQKGICSTLYLGVCKNNEGKMIAHAWTRCGSFYVTGGLNRSMFTIVAKFSI